MRTAGKDPMLAHIAALLMLCTQILLAGVKVTSNVKL
jgi:hypothetical protein